MRQPSWICFTRVGTTHEEHLGVFMTVQSLAVIGAVISIVFDSMKSVQGFRIPRGSKFVLSHYFG